MWCVCWASYSTVAYAQALATFTDSQQRCIAALNLRSDTLRLPITVNSIHKKQ
jgi:hypothetical protein